VKDLIQQIEGHDLVEKHIRRLIGLEETQAKILIKKYRISRERIKQRLYEVRPGSFSETQLKMVLTQIDTGLSALKRASRQELKLGFEMVRDQGTEDLVKELNYFEEEFIGILQPIPVDQVLASAGKVNFLFNQFEASIEAYNVHLRNRIQNELTQSLIEKSNVHSVIHRISKFFGDEEWKIHRIVRTELHNTYNIAKIGGMRTIKEDYVPDLMKGLVHPMDERTADDSKDLARKDPVVNIDKPFVHYYNGKKYVFMAPPQRPNEKKMEKKNIQEIV
jgi:hypothetical protein